MQSCLSFADVLIKPKYSTIVSRKDVKVEVKAFGQKYFPVISSNMDTVTSSEMTHAMFNFPNLEGPGARGCLHRFWTIEENVEAFKKSATQSWVSFGLGELELSRAKALKDAGAATFVLDVAHGANIQVVKQVKAFRESLGYFPSLIVGNFATSESIQEFNKALEGNNFVDGYKVGIGGGSACTTRVVTGAGMPTLASLLECSKLGFKLIADGGMKTSGDIAKALSVPNVVGVFLGGMLAGTSEAPGKPFTDVKFLREGELRSKITHKKYRGSASEESYAIQNKDASWRTAEGESFLVPCKGPVKNVLEQIDAGLRSSFSYVGASNLKEFQQKAELMIITQNGFQENGAHGKNL